MTAMNLHRYPSPSGGVALGKMGVGATMLGWINPYQTSDNALIAMWDGLQGGFTELFGLSTAESSIVRIDGGIRCTSSASITVTDQRFAYGEYGSFTFQLCYKDFAIQGRKDITSRDTAQFGQKGNTFFNVNNGAGARFETYYNHNGGVANDALLAMSSIPPSGTISFGLEASAGSFTKKAWSGDSMTATRTNGWPNLATNYLKIAPFLNCTIHGYRVYNRILTDAEIANFCAIDKERFGLS